MNSSRPPVGGSFQLTDHHGRAVTEASYHGRFALLFFGFTHCRVVCPRALTKLSGVLNALGPLADRVQPLYITVDPERDTPDVMRTFLGTYPRFTGLTGSREQIDAVKQAFRVFAERAVDPDDKNGYAVPHTAITYLLGPDGELVAHFTDALTAEDLRVRLQGHLDPATLP
ncbi:SCO family protein [Bradyrhizobium prioriisuperbiae]|uniref:SCO family protein n=1 Tax=Bradyrhizobium prioriisuperbiae TaxID=2854389 RepID=UPI0028EFFC81|nr:SCO family protein [Bradyrhizobium prioritasuperba]